MVLPFSNSLVLQTKAFRSFLVKLKTKAVLESLKLFPLAPVITILENPISFPNIAKVTRSGSKLRKQSSVELRLCSIGELQCRNRGPFTRAAFCVPATELLPVTGSVSSIAICNYRDSQLSFGNQAYCEESFSLSLDLELSAENLYLMLASSLSLFGKLLKS